MRLKRISKKVIKLLGLIFLPSLVNVLCKTVKFNIINHKSVLDLHSGSKNYVAAFWHGTMLVPWYLHRRRNFFALVSRSGDGEILNRVLQKWHYNTARGSSNVGGKEVLELLIDRAKFYFSIAITPDGPTGPPFKMKAGAVITAQKSGIPLILIGVYNQKKFKLNSWDEFEIPKPFSKVNVIYSDPVFIDSKLTYEETSSKIAEIENLMNKCQREAEKIC